MMGLAEMNQYPRPRRFGQVTGLPLEPGEQGVAEGTPVICVDAIDAEHWLKEGSSYTFLRWGNKGLVQVKEHSGVNFRADRFVAQR